MCGQMRITTPPWKATFNYVLVSVCGVQFWTISWLVLSSLKVVLQEKHTSNFCRRNCPDFWMMCLWILNKWGCTYFLILHMKLEIPELSFPWAMDEMWRSPQLASQVSRRKPTGLLCVRMDEITGLQCEGGNAICIAWSHFECRRLHQKQSAEAAMSNLRSSQPSGSLCCSRRWNFWKPSLSTNQFKLKIISHSYLYIYISNLSCIVLVYYFVPFIVNNRYLLF